MSASLVFHILIFLLPIGWLVSSHVANEEAIVVLTADERAVSLLESVLDAPIEMAPEEHIPEEFSAPEDFSSRPEEFALAKISLPTLINDNPAISKPISKPQPAQEEKLKAEAEAASEVIEKEVQKRLDREGGKSGAIQISLIWNNGNDLDVYVQTPVADIIAFNYKNSRCGGELDVDMNAKKVQSLKPVENVVWQPAKAPFGVFTVGVHEYQNHGFRDPTPFLLSVKVHGESHHFRGTIRSGTPVKPMCKFQRTANGVKFLETPETFGTKGNGKPVFK